MSDLDEQLTRAVSAHGGWKLRLRDAIDTGKDLSTPDRVRVDNACEFGKWLYAAGPDLAGSPHYADVQRLHAEFHLAAAAVLALALAGRKPEAVAAMAPGSPYARASAALTARMMAWRGSA